MKCPKCGYNSFEYLNSCKKCNASLVAFKETIGLRHNILPAGAVAAVFAATAADSVIQQAADGSSDADIFQWDIPAEELSPPAEKPAIAPPPLPLEECTNVSDALNSLDTFSFDDLPPTAAAGAESAGDSGIEEFSFNLQESDPADGIPPDEGAIQEKYNEQTADGESSDSISFGELPPFQSDDIFPGDALTPVEAAGQAVPSSEQANVFGEFPFDAFGEVSADDQQDEPSRTTIDAPAEFDLSSFLASDGPFAAEGTGDPQHTGELPLAGSELDTLFGELAEPDKKH